MPGHRGIPGNEEADRLAKEACSIPPQGTEAKATLAAAKGLANNRYNEALQAY